MQAEPKNRQAGLILDLDPGMPRALPPDKTHTYQARVEHFGTDAV